MIKPQKYTRKTFEVSAIQVTEENIGEVAKWCNGEIMVAPPTHNKKVPSKFIKVRVHHPLNSRQTKAFVGDWVLYAGTGYKVYPTKAFKECFVEKPTQNIVININRSPNEPFRSTLIPPFREQQP